MHGHDVWPPGRGLRCRFTRRLEGGAGRDRHGQPASDHAANSPLLAYRLAVDLGVAGVPRRVEAPMSPTVAAAEPIFGQATLSLFAEAARGG